MGIVLPIMSQVLGMNDYTITIICISTALISLICILLAKTPKILCISVVIVMFTDTTTTSIRSAITKIVNDNEVGNVVTSITFTNTDKYYYSSVVRNK